MRASRAWFACLLLLPTPALAVTDADRLAVYKEFRTHFDARQYEAARPLAEKLVQLTEEQYGPEELPLATPLTNLATVNYKLGNFPAAIENYQRSLRILQSKSTLADKAQIPPLLMPQMERSLGSLLMLRSYFFSTKGSISSMRKVAYWSLRVSYSKLRFLRGCAPCFSAG